MSELTPKHAIVPSAKTIAEALSCGKPGCTCHRTAQIGKGNTHCPSHNDKNPSLFVSEKGGKVFVNCKASCSQDAVIKALQERGLWPTGAAGVDLQALAQAKGLPVGFLKALGLSDCSYNRRPAVRICYFNAQGELTGVRFRLSLDGPNRFAWRKGDKVSLYGLEQLDAIRQGGWCLLVEGESDRWTALHYDIPVLGIPGKGTWRTDMADLLMGLEIFIWQEPDAEDLTDRVGKDIPNLKVIPVPDGLKDLSEAHLQGLDVPALVEGLKAQAVPYRELRRVGQEEQRAALYLQARELLHAPDLWGRIGRVISSPGYPYRYVGDTRPALLAYAAIISRLLGRPLNLAFIALSGAGKNAAVDAALGLAPEDSYIVVKAGSARALIYADDYDYQHKVVVVAEADSLPEEGPAASAIRSLAADNSMTYDVVEKGEKTGRFKTRHIVKLGPTGLLTTSTKPLGGQMATRMLEVPIPDTEEQTRAVLHAQAEAVVGAEQSPVELAPFIALQSWLSLGGSRGVVVPFAKLLADLVPVSAVRLRRDFRQLLTAIQSIALLYQEQRPRTPDGMVVATLEDYAMARDLLAPIFEAVIADGLTPAMRETVEAVAEGGELSRTEIARRLNLSKSTISWRVRRCLQAGWLREIPTKKLVRGEPLPPADSALPSVESVAQRWGEGGYITPETIRTLELPEVVPGFEQFESSNRNQDERQTPSPSPEFCAICGGEVYIFTPKGEPFCRKHAPELAEVAESW